MEAAPIAAFFPGAMNTFDIPLQLASERLILRPFVEADWRSMHAHYAHPECTRYTLGRVLTEGESWRLTAALAGHWLLRGYGPYALEDKASGAMIGAAGLWHPVDFPEREIKWALLPEAQGRGYAREAAGTILRMLQDVWPGEPPISFIDQRNTASIRVALAIGARLERVCPFRGAEFGIYRHVYPG